MCRICISQRDAIERKPFSRIECPTIKFKFELTLIGMLQRGQSKPTRKLGLLASEKYLRSAFFKSCSFFNQASGRVYKFVWQCIIQWAIKFLFASLVQIQEIPAFLDFTIRDSHYFVTLFFEILKTKIQKKTRSKVLRS